MKIRIKDMRVDAVIGIYDWEKEKKRPLILNFDIDVDSDAATKSDAIEDSFDYSAMEEIAAFIEATKFGLLEKLAGEVLKKVIALPHVQKATVEIDKPKALACADSVSIIFSMERNGESA
ncbi:MAG: dihydroneopterin aldolase [Alphaproteobacteria bacterium]